MTNEYRIEDLPPLPKPWYWERGKDDGDPAACRREYGWFTRVHEAVACSFRDDQLGITVCADRPGPRVNKSVMHRSGSNGPNFAVLVPLSVFRAVHTALCKWYGIEEANEKICDED